MKKFLSLALALCVMLALAVTAFATEVNTSTGTGSVPVTVSAEAARFSVTVPTSLPMDVDENGEVTTLPAEIRNGSAGPVKITNLEIVHVGEWATVNYDSTDLSKDKIGTKHVAVTTGMTTNTDKSKWEKTTGPDAITFTAANWDVINGGSTLSISYDAYIPLQATALTNVTVANLIFTVAWNAA